MAFESLTEKLSAAFKKLRGKGRLTEADVKESMREIRLALLEADVSYKVVKDFIKKVTDRCVGTDVLESLTPAQMIVKIVNEELTALMGGSSTNLTVNPKPPTVVMLVGLQGAGKTTNGAKLAGLLKKQNGRHPLLAACDIYRPAAIQQLEVVGAQLDIPVFQMGQTDPVNIAKSAVDYAKKHGNDLVLLDTAGRLHVDEALMTELKNIKAAVNPDEILLVVDAMIGQDAVNAASAFDEALDITGVVLTKLDGDARGGAALSIKATTGKPIKFIGTGEKLDCIEVFHPERMASRILGMGDMLSLIEKAQENFDAQKAKELEEKMRKNRFTLADFLDQMQQIKGMGDLSALAGMLPGVNASMLEGADPDGKAMAHTEAIIQSMTPAEREDPTILNASRKRRIAQGCGLTVADVNRLLKQFESMQQLMKAVSGGKLPAGLMGGKMPKGMMGGMGRMAKRAQKQKKKKKK
jgi:signal recognition particle subunit SRP54